MGGTKDEVEEKIKLLVDNFIKRGKHIEVIIVEDEESHVELIEHSLTRVNLLTTVFSNGEDFLDYIFYKKIPNQEYIIILDYLLPGASGKDVLISLKNNPTTNRIPVIVLTGYADQETIDEFYNLGCSFLVSKPATSSEFFKLIYEIGKILSLISLPTN